eukprot:4912047-Amphidinium_carterae.1
MSTHEGVTYYAQCGSWQSVHVLVRMPLLAQSVVRLAGAFSNHLSGKPGQRMKRHLIKVLLEYSWKAVSFVTCATGWLEVGIR